MKLHAVLGACLFVAASSAATPTASAEPRATAPMSGDRPGESLTRGYIVVDHADLGEPDDAIAANPNSNIIFLNSCRPNGCRVQSGSESSQNYTSNGVEYTGRSSIISGTRTVSAWRYTDQVWNQVVQCVRETFAPFNIVVTDQDPGTQRHWEAIVAGSPQEVGMQSGVAGVSPYYCGSNGMATLINDTITYSFANILGADVAEICWTVSQEVAHSFGLDHQMLNSDPMTYLTNGPQYKRFQNQAANCGEYSARRCDNRCPGSSNNPTQQNSYQKIMGIFGGAAPTPPVITFVEPAHGANVSPGQRVHVDIQDDQGVASATLSVNGSNVTTLTFSPWIFNLPATLGEGTHRVTVTAVDTFGASGSASIDVVIGPPCQTPGDCRGQGDNLTCVGGRCVPGDGAPGGLGSECEGPEDCYSGQCAQGSGGEKYCVEFCTIGGSDCPGGYKCVNAGGQGVCWPSGDDGGGCSTDGGAPTLPILLGVGLAALLVRRRDPRRLR